MVMLEYLRAQNSGWPLHGWVFVCVGSADVVELVEKFPDIVVVVLGRPEIAVMLLDDVDTVDLESVAAVALEAALREEDIVDEPKVILEEKDWYVPVGVRCSVTDRVLDPVKNVRPSVVSDGAWATAWESRRMLVSPRTRMDAIVPIMVTWSANAEA